MEPKARTIGGFASLGVAMLLLATPTVIFWRPHLPFFYIIDDWTALIQMSEEPFWQYVLRPDGEQWFPFFHLIFYGLVRMAGERYDLLLLVNCLGTGVNALLLCRFLGHHFSAGLALILSFFYALAAVHHAIAWNAFYLCYVLSLGFFLGALLLTHSYLRAPSFPKLLGVGLCSLLSILSHNYTLLGLATLPLYAVLLGEPQKGKGFWPLTLTLGVVYLAFALGYLRFAGFTAAASHNLTIFSGLPGPNYLLHLLSAAILSPFLYLFWGHFHFPVWSYVAASLLLTASLGTLWLSGGPPERRLGLWALLFNILPIVLISLTRYQRSVNQAFVARYGIFTLIGALLLLGTAFSLLAARLSQRRWFKLAALGLFLFLVSGQFASLPIWRAKYLDMSRAATVCYQMLYSRENFPEVAAKELFRQFCPTAHPNITPNQAIAIHRFLRGLPKEP